MKNLVYLGCMLSNKETRTPFNSWSVLGFVTTPISFILLLMVPIVKVAFWGVLVPKAESVNNNDANALSPPICMGDTLIAATGLSFNSPEETSQSKAFFNTPGIPKAYSGVENIMPSAALIWFLK